jgi:hypothetical protein
LGTETICSIENRFLFMTNLIIRYGEIRRKTQKLDHFCCVTSGGCASGSTGLITLLAWAGDIPVMNAG